MSSCLDSKVKRSARDTLTFQIKVYKPSIEARSFSYIHYTYTTFLAFTLHR